jgi:hypothetical protein
MHETINVLPFIYPHTPIWVGSDNSKSGYCEVLLDILQYLRSHRGTEEGYRCSWKLGPNLCESAVCGPELLTPAINDIQFMK